MAGEGLSASECRLALSRCSPDDIVRAFSQLLELIRPEAPQCVATAGELAAACEQRMQPAGGGATWACLRCCRRGGQTAVRRRHRAIVDQPCLKPDTWILRNCVKSQPFNTVINPDGTACVLDYTDRAASWAPGHDGDLGIRVSYDGFQSEVRVQAFSLRDVERQLIRAGVYSAPDMYSPAEVPSFMRHAVTVAPLTRLTFQRHVKWSPCSSYFVVVTGERVCTGYQPNGSGMRPTECTLQLFNKFGAPLAVVSTAPIRLEGAEQATWHAACTTWRAIAPTDGFIDVTFLASTTEAGSLSVVLGLLGADGILRVAELSLETPRMEVGEHSTAASAALPTGVSDDSHAVTLAYAVHDPRHIMHRFDILGLFNLGGFVTLSLLQAAPTGERVLADDHGVAALEEYLVVVAGSFTMKDGEMHTSAGPTGRSGTASGLEQVVQNAVGVLQLCVQRGETRSTSLSMLHVSFPGETTPDFAPPRRAEPLSQLLPIPHPACWSGVQHVGGGASLIDVLSCHVLNAVFEDTVTLRAFATQCEQVFRAYNRAGLYGSPDRAANVNASFAELYFDAAMAVSGRTSALLPCTSVPDDVSFMSPPSEIQQVAFSPPPLLVPHDINEEAVYAISYPLLLSVNFADYISIRRLTHSGAPQEIARLQIDSRSAHSCGWQDATSLIIVDPECCVRSVKLDWEREADGDSLVHCTSTEILRGVSHPFSMSIPSESRTVLLARSRLPSVREATLRSFAAFVAETGLLNGASNATQAIMDIPFDAVASPQLQILQQEPANEKLRRRLAAATPFSATDEDSMLYWVNFCQRHHLNPETVHASNFLHSCRRSRLTFRDRSAVDVCMFDEQAILNSLPALCQSKFFYPLAMAVLRASPSTLLAPTASEDSLNGLVWQQLLQSIPKVFLPIDSATATALLHATAELSSSAQVSYQHRLLDALEERFNPFLWAYLIHQSPVNAAATLASGVNFACEEVIAHVRSTAALQSGEAGPLISEEELTKGLKAVLGAASSPMRIVKIIRAVLASCEHLRLQDVLDVADRMDINLPHEATIALLPRLEPSGKLKYEQLSLLGETEQHGDPASLDAIFDKYQIVRGTAEADSLLRWVIARAIRISDITGDVNKGASFIPVAQNALGIEQAALAFLARDARLLHLCQRRRLSATRFANVSLRAWLGASTAEQLHLLDSNDALMLAARTLFTGKVDPMSARFAQQTLSLLLPRFLCRPTASWQQDSQILLRIIRMLLGMPSNGALTVDLTALSLCSLALVFRVAALSNNALSDLEPATQLLTAVSDKLASPTVHEGGGSLTHLQSALQSLSTTVPQVTGPTAPIDTSVQYGVTRALQAVNFLASIEGLCKNVHKASASSLYAAVVQELAGERGDGISLLWILVFAPSMGMRRDTVEPLKSLVSTFAHRQLSTKSLYDQLHAAKGAVTTALKSMPLATASRATNAAISTAWDIAGRATRVVKDRFNIAIPQDMMHIAPTTVRLVARFLSSLHTVLVKADQLGVSSEVVTTGSAVQALMHPIADALVSIKCGFFRPESGDLQSVVDSVQKSVGHEGDANAAAFVAAFLHALFNASTHFIDRIGPQNAVEYTAHATNVLQALSKCTMQSAVGADYQLRSSIESSLRLLQGCDYVYSLRDDVVQYSSILPGELRHLSPCDIIDRVVTTIPSVFASEFSEMETQAEYTDDTMPAHVDSMLYDILFTCADGLNAFARNEHDLGSVSHSSTPSMLTPKKTIASMFASPEPRPKKRNTQADQVTLLQDVESRLKQVETSDLPTALQGWNFAFKSGQTSTSSLHIHETLLQLCKLLGVQKPSELLQVRCSLVTAALDSGEVQTAVDMATSIMSSLPDYLDAESQNGLVKALHLLSRVASDDRTPKIPRQKFTECYLMFVAGGMVQPQQFGLVRLPTMTDTVYDASILGADEPLTSMSVPVSGLRTFNTLFLEALHSSMAEAAAAVKSFPPEVRALHRHQLLKPFSATQADEASQFDAFTSTLNLRGLVLHLAAACTHSGTAEYLADAFQQAFGGPDAVQPSIDNTTCADFFRDIAKCCSNVFVQESDAAVDIAFALIASIDAAAGVGAARHGHHAWREGVETIFQGLLAAEELSADRVAKVVDGMIQNKLIQRVMADNDFQGAILASILGVRSVHLFPLRDALFKQFAIMGGQIQSFAAAMSACIAEYDSLPLDASFLLDAGNARLDAEAPSAFVPHLILSARQGSSAASFPARAVLGMLMHSAERFAWNKDTVCGYFLLKHVKHLNDLVAAYTREKEFESIHKPDLLECLVSTCFRRNDSSLESRALDLLPKFPTPALLRLHVQFSPLLQAIHGSMDSRAPSTLIARLQTLFAGHEDNSVCTTAAGWCELEQSFLRTVSGAPLAITHDLISAVQEAGWPFFQRDMHTEDLLVAASSLHCFQVTIPELSRRLQKACLQTVKAHLLSHLPVEQSSAPPPLFMKSVIACLQMAQVAKAVGSATAVPVFHAVEQASNAFKVAIKHFCTERQDIKACTTFLQILLRRLASAAHGEMHEAGFVLPEYQAESASDQSLYSSLMPYANDESATSVPNYATFLHLVGWLKKLAAAPDHVTKALGITDGSAALVLRAWMYSSGLLDKDARLQYLLHEIRSRIQAATELRIPNIPTDAVTALPDMMLWDNVGKLNETLATLQTCDSADRLNAILQEVLMLDIFANQAEAQAASFFDALLVRTAERPARLQHSAAQLVARMLLLTNIVEKLEGVLQQVDVRSNKTPVLDQCLTLMVHLEDRISDDSDPVTAVHAFLALLSREPETLSLSSKPTQLIEGLIRAFVTGIRNVTSCIETFNAGELSTPDLDPLYTIISGMTVLTTRTDSHPSSFHHLAWAQAVHKIVGPPMPEYANTYAHNSLLSAALGRAVFLLSSAISDSRKLKQRDKPFRAVAEVLTTLATSSDGCLTDAQINAKLLRDIYANGDRLRGDYWANSLVNSCSVVLSTLGYVFSAQECVHMPGSIANKIASDLSASCAHRDLLHLLALSTAFGCWPLAYLLLAPDDAFNGDVQNAIQMIHEFVGAQRYSTEKSTDASPLSDLMSLPGFVAKAAFTVAKVTASAATGGVLPAGKGNGYTEADLLSAAEEWLEDQIARHGSTSSPNRGREASYTDETESAYLKGGVASWFATVQRVGRNVVESVQAVRFTGSHDDLNEDSPQGATVVASTVDGNNGAGWEEEWGDTESGGQFLQATSRTQAQRALLPPVQALVRTSPPDDIISMTAWDDADAVHAMNMTSPDGHHPSVPEYHLRNEAAPSAKAIEHEYNQVNLESPRHTTPSSVTDAGHLPSTSLNAAALNAQIDASMPPNEGWAISATFFANEAWNEPTFPTAIDSVDATLEPSGISGSDAHIPGVQGDVVGAVAEPDSAWSGTRQSSPSPIASSTSDEQSQDSLVEIGGIDHTAAPGQGWNIDVHIPSEGICISPSATAQLLTPLQGPEPVEADLEAPNRISLSSVLQDDHHLTAEQESAFDVLDVIPSPSPVIPMLGLVAPTAKPADPPLEHREHVPAFPLESTDEMDVAELENSSHNQPATVGGESARIAEDRNLAYDAYGLRVKRDIAPQEHVLDDLAAERVTKGGEGDRAEEVVRSLSAVGSTSFAEEHFEGASLPVAALEPDAPQAGATALPRWSESQDADDVETGSATHVEEGWTFDVLIPSEQVSIEPYAHAHVVEQPTASPSPSQIDLMEGGGHAELHDHTAAIGPPEDTPSQGIPQDAAMQSYEQRPHDIPGVDQTDGVSEMRYAAWHAVDEFSAAAPSTSVQSCDIQLAGIAAPAGADAPSEVAMLQRDDFDSVSGYDVRMEHNVDSHEVADMLECGAVHDDHSLDGGWNIDVDIPLDEVSIEPFATAHIIQPLTETPISSIESGEQICAPEQHPVADLVAVTNGAGVALPHDTAVADHQFLHDLSISNLVEPQRIGSQEGEMDITRSALPLSKVVSAALEAGQTTQPAEPNSAILDLGSGVDGVRSVADGWDVDITAEPGLSTTEWPVENTQREEAASAPLLIPPEHVKIARVEEVDSDQWAGVENVEVSPNTELEVGVAAAVTISDAGRDTGHGKERDAIRTMSPTQILSDQSPDNLQLDTVPPPGDAISDSASQEVVALGCRIEDEGAESPRDNEDVEAPSMNTTLRSTAGDHMPNEVVGVMASSVDISAAPVVQSTLSNVAAVIESGEGAPVHRDVLCSVNARELVVPTSSSSRLGSHGAGVDELPQLEAGRNGDTLVPLARAAADATAPVGVSTTIELTVDTEPLEAESSVHFITFGPDFARAEFGVAPTVSREVGSEEVALSGSIFNPVEELMESGVVEHINVAEGGWDFDIHIPNDEISIEPSAHARVISSISPPNDIADMECGTATREIANARDDNTPPTRMQSPHEDTENVTAPTLQESTDAYAQPSAPALHMVEGTQSQIDQLASNVTDSDTTPRHVMGSGDYSAGWDVLECDAPSEYRRGHEPGDETVIADVPQTLPVRNAPAECIAEVELPVTEAPEAHVTQVDGAPVEAVASADGTGETQDQLSRPQSFHGQWGVDGWDVDAVPASTSNIVDNAVHLAHSNMHIPIQAGASMDRLEAGIMQDTTVPYAQIDVNIPSDQVSFESSAHAQEIYSTAIELAVEEAQETGDVVHSESERGHSTLQECWGRRDDDAVTGDASHSPESNEQHTETDSYPGRNDGSNERHRESPGMVQLAGYSSEEAVPAIGVQRDIDDNSSWNPNDTSEGLDDTGDDFVPIAGPISSSVMLLAKGMAWLASELAPSLAAEGDGLRDAEHSPEVDSREAARPAQSPPHTDTFESDDVPTYDIRDFEDGTACALPWLAKPNSGAHMGDAEAADAMHDIESHASEGDIVMMQYDQRSQHAVDIDRAVSPGEWGTSGSVDLLVTKDQLGENSHLDDAVSQVHHDTLEHAAWDTGIGETTTNRAPQDAVPPVDPNTGDVVAHVADSITSGVQLFAKGFAWLTSELTPSLTGTISDHQGVHWDEDGGLHQSERRRDGHSQDDGGSPEAASQLEGGLQEISEASDTQPHSEVGADSATRNATAPPTNPMEGQATVNEVDPSIVTQSRISDHEGWDFQAIELGNDQSEAYVEPTAGWIQAAELRDHILNAEHATNAQQELHAASTQAVDGSTHNYKADVHSFGLGRDVDASIQPIDFASANVTLHEHQDAGKTIEHGDLDLESDNDGWGDGWGIDDGILAEPEVRHSGVRSPANALHGEPSSPASAPQHAESTFMDVSGGWRVEQSGRASEDALVAVDLSPEQVADAAPPVPMPVSQDADGHSLASGTMGWLSDIAGVAMHGDAAQPTSADKGVARLTSFATTDDESEDFPSPGTTDLHTGTPERAPRQKKQLTPKDIYEAAVRQLDVEIDAFALLDQMAPLPPA